MLPSTNILHVSYYLLTLLIGFFLIPNKKKLQLLNPTKQIFLWEKDKKEPNSISKPKASSRHFIEVLKYYIEVNLLTSISFEPACWDTPHQSNLPEQDIETTNMLLDSMCHVKGSQRKILLKRKQMKFLYQHNLMHNGELLGNREISNTYYSRSIYQNFHDLGIRSLNFS